MDQKSQKTEEDINPFKKISSELIYKNPWIEVREDHVIRPGGSKGIFGVITYNTYGGVTILAVTKDRSVYLIKEFKYGSGHYATEAPSGAVDEGESYVQAAQRELAEECGLRAEEWIDLGFVDHAGTIMKSRSKVFIAQDLSEVEAHPDEGEVIEVRKVTLEEAVRMVEENEITHPASCIAILRAEKMFT